MDTLKYIVLSFLRVNFPMIIGFLVCISVFFLLNSFELPELLSAAISIICMLPAVYVTSILFNFWVYKYLRKLNKPD